MSLHGTPKAEYPIDIDLVCNLLKSQHPDLAELPLTELDTGWDNVMFRLGDQYLVRLPRRSLSAKLIHHEQQWLPKLVEQLPLPIPNPIRVGKPDCGYPWSWSVLPWLEGSSADLCEPQPNQVEPFTSFLRALHIPAPPNAPVNSLRNVELKAKTSLVEKHVQNIEKRTPGVISNDLLDIWKEAISKPMDVCNTWIHGDLHAMNVLVNQGTISAIVDWGDFTSGDRAIDLASIWMLFPERETRQRAVSSYNPISENTILRAKGWAFFYGVVLFHTGSIDNPRFKRMGEKTLERLTIGP